MSWIRKYTSKFRDRHARATKNPMTMTAPANSSGLVTVASTDENEKLTAAPARPRFLARPQRFSDAYDRSRATPQRSDGNCRSHSCISCAYKRLIIRRLDMQDFADIMRGLETDGGHGAVPITLTGLFLPGSSMCNGHQRLDGFGGHRRCPRSWCSVCSAAAITPRRRK
jgi:hypothetical protein